MSMSHYQADVTWRLPSEVDTDSSIGPESRVPLLGLHMTSHLGNTDLSLSSMENVDSLYDSGVELLSGVLSCGPELDDTLLKFRRLRVTHECPKTDLTQDSINVLYSTSSDEGFQSGDNFLSVSHTGHNESCQNQLDSIQKMDIMNQIFSHDEDGDTQLHMAIIHGYSDAALQIINIAPSQDYLDIQNNLRQTVLHLAVCTGMTSVARKLVARGAQVDVQDHHGNTPLHIACRIGNKDCVRALTQPISNQELKECPYQQVFQKLPQDPEIKNYEGQTCLHLAASQGHIDIMVYLLSAKFGADINTPDGGSGKTVLHHAIESQCFPIIALALRIASTDVNVRTYNGVTPLQVAQSHGYSDIAKALIARGAQTVALTSDSDNESSWCDSEEEFMDL